MRKSEAVELFGRKFDLCERDAFDRLELHEAQKKMTDKDPIISNMIIMCQSLSDGLKFNLRPFWNKIRFGRKLSCNGLMKLSVEEINDLFGKLMELEGLKKNSPKGKQ